MKIAIRGHESRGNEVIQILENLGGENTEKLKGTYTTFYYIDDKNKIGDDQKESFPPTYKLYTLEEFEKEFPFKIGDTVITLADHKPHKITALEYYNDKLCYVLDTSFHYTPQGLKYYKEMKEERNIILTLDKAKEWYKKGGELKEIALQAFTEKELTKVDLPKTWEEFCENFPVKKGECFFEPDDEICVTSLDGRKRTNKDWIPSKKSAEAHLAMIQLEQLRDCWRQGWKPTPHQIVFAIKFAINGLGVYEYYSREFLSFKDRKTATEFLKCFRDLIEQAGDLI